MTDSTPPAPQRPRYRGRFAGGVLLLILGGLLLADNLGYTLPHHWYMYWPWLLVGLGVAQLLWPGTLRDRMGGYWLLVTGGYGLAATYRFLGLDWATAAPIFLIALGLRIVLGSALSRIGRHAQ